MLDDRSKFEIDQSDIWRPDAFPAGGPSHARCCDADTFAELTRAVTQAKGIRDARRQLVLCSANVLATSHIALTRRFDDDRLGFVMVADDPARRAANAEHQTGQGPVWEVHATASPVHSNDLAVEPRWREFAQRAVENIEIRSVLAVPLTCGGELLGALVAYADRTGFFSKKRLDRADLLSTHAGAALASITTQVKARNLEIALRTNREIATAIGIVMNRFRLTNDQAFSYLTQVSQQRHLKLSALADRIVVSGEVPALAPGGLR